MSKRIYFVDIKGMKWVGESNGVGFRFERLGVWLSYEYYGYWRRGNDFKGDKYDKLNFKKILINESLCSIYNVLCIILIILC